MSKRRGYSAVLVVLLVGILLAGSYALSLLVEGKAAYPVRMFGHARLSAELRGSQLIRPTAVMPSMGSLPDLLKLALPPVPGATATETAVSDPAREALTGPEVRLLDAARAFNESKDWERSIRLYDALAAAHPASSDLQLERARVLSWAGRSAAAADALLAVARARRSAAIAYEAAQNYWWAGKSIAADAALDVALSIDAKYPGAVALREQVRRASSPGIPLARAWAENGGTLEQLIYARALVAGQEFAQAIGVYRRALALGAVDSVHLELAAAANAADSADVAVDAMRDYLALHPQSDETRLALARQYGWSARYDEAIHEYDRLIDAGRSDVAIERAQTIVWAGSLEAGAQALRALVARDSTQPDAWRLLGDVDRWLGRPEQALEAYREAERLLPGNTEVALQIAAVEQDIIAAKRAYYPSSAARVRVEGVQDTEGFTYMQTRAEQYIATRWGGFRLAALNTLPSRTMSGMSSASTGFGGAATVVYRPLERLQLSAGGSAQHYEDVATFLGWNAGATMQTSGGMTLALNAVREPAVRRTGTLLSLQARTVSERIELLASGRLGTWGWSAQGERERLTSDLGATNRTAAAVAASYALTKHLTFESRISALSSSAASPTLPGFGALYWSPERYIEPTAGLAYRSDARKGLAFGLGASGGYAFITERPGPGARFTGSGMPTFGLRADATYQRGAWTVVLDAGYGGALGRGYRSLNTGLGISYTLPR